VAVFRRAGVTLPITDLSDGYRAMLAVVLDLVIRYARLFAGSPEPLAGEATVVIDEVDLNLHPRWQRRVIEQLTALFPRTRFVLTTHAPTVVQAAIDEKHAVLVLDEKPGEGTVVRPLKDLARLDGAEVDSVLVEVFDLPSYYSPTYEKIEDRAASLRERVEEGKATPRERQELLRLLDELQGLLARDDDLKRSGRLMSEIARTQIGLLRILDKQVVRKEKGEA
jgi:predicted ATP-binding protein involved in virulence